MADTNVASTARAQHAKGLHSHAFLPSVRGPILGLWESKVPLTPEEMEFYLDAPDGPLGDWGALVSRARPVAPMGAVLPASTWDEASAPEGKPGTGSFLWVHLRRRTTSAGAVDDIIDVTNWAQHDGAPGGLFSPHPSKLHSHFYLPVDHRDEDAGSIFCVYETSDPMGAADFGGFLEGPQSPFPHTAYSHVAHEVLPGRLTRLPAAHFARRARGFFGNAWMPFMDDSMGGLGAMSEAFSAAALHDDMRTGVARNAAAEVSMAEKEVVLFNDKEPEAIAEEAAAPTPSELDDARMHEVVEEVLPLEIKSQFTKKTKKPVQVRGQEVEYEAEDYDA